MWLAEAVNRAVRVTQEVRINGELVGAADARVRESSDERVKEVSFSVARGAAGYGPIPVGTIVEIKHTDGAGLELKDVAEVMHVETRRMASGERQKRVTANTLEARAKRLRIRQQWKGKTASEVVAGIWGEGRAEELGLTLGDVSGNNERLEEVTSVFNSLYELMEEVCRLTEWAWGVENGAVVFYDPALRAASPAIKAGRFFSDSFRAEQDVRGVVNRVTAEAWEYQNRQIVKTFGEPTCVGAVQDADMPSHARGWEAIGARVVDPERFRDAEVSLDIEHRRVEVRGQQLALDAGEPLRVDYAVRRAVFIQRSDSASIAEYGVRHGPLLKDDGGWTVPAAQDYADAMLRAKAWPSVHLQVDVFELGYRRDTRVPVEIDDPSINTTLWVTHVERVWEDGFLLTRVEAEGAQVALESLGAAGGYALGRAGPPDVMREVARRVERLERSPAHLSGLVGVVSGETGVISGVQRPSGDSAWGYEVQASGPVDLSAGTGWGAVIEARGPVSISQAWGASFALLVPIDLSAGTGWGADVGALEPPMAEVVPQQAETGWGVESFAGLPLSAEQDAAAAWGQSVEPAPFELAKTESAAAWAQSVVVPREGVEGVTAWGVVQQVEAFEPGDELVFAIRGPADPVDVVYFGGTPGTTAWAADLFGGMALEATRLFPDAAADWLVQQTTQPVPGPEPELAARAWSQEVEAPRAQQQAAAAWGVEQEAVEYFAVGDFAILGPGDTADLEVIGGAPGTDVEDYEVDLFGGDA